MVDYDLLVVVLSIIIPIGIMFAARAMDRKVKKGEDVTDEVEEMKIKLERIDERVSNHIERGRHNNNGR